MQNQVGDSGNVDNLEQVLLSLKDVNALDAVDAEENTVDAETEEKAVDAVDAETEENAVEAVDAVNAEIEENAADAVDAETEETLWKLRLRRKQKSL